MVILMALLAMKIRYKEIVMPYLDFEILYLDQQMPYKEI